MKSVGNLAWNYRVNETNDGVGDRKTATKYTSLPLFYRLSRQHAIVIHFRLMRKSTLGLALSGVLTSTQWDGGNSRALPGAVLTGATTLPPITVKPTVAQNWIFVYVIHIWQV